jgi:ATP-binding cassette, subfamily F, member 3
VRVLSGGERTRLAVARMLLRPANTLLLDEPTNHLDLDSKDVLLEALEDFGGTLIFVSHDRYFVDKLATKVIDIGRGDAVVYPGNYEEFLWSKRARETGAPATEGRGSRREVRRPKAAPPPDLRSSPPTPKGDTGVGSRFSIPGQKLGPIEKGDLTPKGERSSYEDKKRADAESRRSRKEADARQRRIADLEARIAKAETAIKELEATMSAPGFYENHESARPVLDRHQALMWEVGDLMNKWETLQADTKV